MDSKRPSLVNADSDNSAMANNNMVNGVDRKAIAYLLRYETMVRQQEAEQLATVAHLRPLFDDFSPNGYSRLEEDIDLEQEISLSQLKEVLQQLEDDDTESYMQTDRQLVMTLRTLTQKNGEGSITWAEFLQCYKTVISGMQTLQSVSAPDLRARCKDRTLNMISLFEPPATKLLDESVEISFEAKRQKSSDKRAMFALLGAIVGAAAAVVSTPYLVPTPQRSTVFATPLSRKDSKKSAASLTDKSPIFSPSSTPNNAETRSTVSVTAGRVGQPLEHRKKLTLPPMQAKKTVNTSNNQSGGAPTFDLQMTGVSAAIGGATGMLVVPAVWAAMQNMPVALASLSVGGWGVVVLSGAILAQGFYHSVGSLVKALRKKNKK